MDDLFDSTYGSTKGGWIYGTLGPAPVAAWVIPLVIAAVIWPLLALSRRIIARAEGPVVAAWFVITFLASLALQSLAPNEMRAVVTNESANAFYSVTSRFPVRYFARHFHELVDMLPLHAKANMPGKTLLYYGLRFVVDSPAMIGLIVSLISHTGGLLLYRIVKSLYADPWTALYSLILYAFLPSRLFFLPLLNTVTPVFALLPLAFFVTYLESKRLRDLIAVGYCLYLLILFEPLPLVTGLVYLALLGQGMRTGRLSGRNLKAVFVVVPLTVLVCVLTTRFALKLDLVRAFLYAWEDAKSFNAGVGRPYGLWVVGNLKDFALGTGIAATAVLIGTITRSVVRRLRRVPSPEPIAEMYLYSVTATVVALDLMGVNRGEVTRLWIFLGTFLLPPVARALTVSSTWPFVAVLSAQLLLTGLHLATIDFIHL